MIWIMISWLQTCRAMQRCWWSVFAWEKVDLTVLFIYMLFLCQFHANIQQWTTWRRVNRCCCIVSVSSCSSSTSVSWELVYTLLTSSRLSRSSASSASSSRSSSSSTLGSSSSDLRRTQKWWETKQMLCRQRIFFHFDILGFQDKFRRI